MKYLKTYNKLNEGLRDKMLPKSDEEIIKEIKKSGNASYYLIYCFKNDYINDIIKLLETIDYLDDYSLLILKLYITSVKSKKDIEKLLEFDLLKNSLNKHQLYLIEKYKLDKHKNELKDYEQEVIDILNNLEYQKLIINNEDILVGKIGDDVYLKYNYINKDLYYHLDRLGVIFRKDEHWASEFIHGLSQQYADMVIGNLISKELNLDYEKLIYSRNDNLHFKIK